MANLVSLVVGWGLLWLLVLNTPFVLVVTGLTFALYRPASGDEVGVAFQQVFAGTVRRRVDAVGFALLNPVVEEMHYRGWLQPAWTALTARA